MFYVVHPLVETDRLCRIVEQVDLVTAVNEAAEAHSHQAKEHPAVVELLEEFMDGAEQDMIAGAVGDMGLTRLGIKI